MKTLLATLSLSLALVGCQVHGFKHEPVTDEDVAQGMHYFQDKRTHLCFGYMSPTPYNAITEVPCEKVQAGLENPWSR